MNIQLKKGFIEICVLSVVKNHPSYGYKIIQDLQSVIVLSESTLYPILRRLESGGYLTSYSQDYRGRLRKYYQITKLGLERIQTFHKEWMEMESVHQFIISKEEKG